MTFAPKPWSSWFRRNLAWSNTRQSWQERGGTLLLFLGAAGLVAWGGMLTLTQLVLLWSVLLVALAALWRRGWLKLFGPVLVFDLVCTARRRRYFILRVIYACALATLFFWIYTVWYFESQRAGRIHVREMAQMAEAVFFTVMSIQFAVVSVLTPAYTAGTIADEKERKTLEFLLATDLRNREIVLSKLAAKMVNLTSLALVGLPVLSFIQFFGGIDPTFLLVSFATLGLTMFSLASFSILNSVLVPRARDAIVLTYLGAVAYLALSAFCRVALLYAPLANFALTPGQNAVTVTDLVEWLSAGNLPVALYKLISSWDRGRGLGDIFPELLRNYALFHGLVMAFCCTAAVLRLRAAALKQSYGKQQRPPLFVRLFGRPRVGHWPMLWKEVLAEPGLRFGWLGRICIVLLFLASFVPPGIMIYQFATADPAPRGGGGWYWNPRERLGREMNQYVRVVSTAVSCLALLAVAVRAAGSVSGERDKQTFDSLLTTPLNSGEILSAKWLGSILCVRWAWLWLVLIWFLGVITGGLHPLAVPMLPTAWLVYAMLFAGVGLWYSTAARTTLRSTILTLLTVVGVSAGHWLVMGMCCYMPLSVFARVSGRDLETLLTIQFGQTPPLVMAWFAMTGEEFTTRYNPKETVQLTLSSFFGLVVWATAAAGVWFVTRERFRRVTLRYPLRRPPGAVVTAVVVTAEKVQA